MSAPPTSTPWVPVWPGTSPGGGGGADLTYEGDHVPATTYEDGDIVVKDGVAYLCVGGPTTVAPDPAPWGAAALAKVAYGTTLPASPVDGQEAILVDSLTNPSYQWRFRYNAGSSSPYKWELVGGAPAIQENIPGTSGITSTTYVQASNAPTFTVPRAGDYEYTLVSQLSNTATPAYTTLALKLGAAAVTDDDSIFTNPFVANGQAVVSRTRKVLGLAAGSLLAPYVKVTAGQGQYIRTSLSVRPVRVS